MAASHLYLSTETITSTGAKLRNKVCFLGSCVVGIMGVKLWGYLGLILGLLDATCDNWKSWNPGFVATWGYL